MRQLKLFYRFFLATIWLGMVNSLSLQAQEIYFFEDFETGGANLFSFQDRMTPPDGWETLVLSGEANNYRNERFYFDDILNDIYNPGYPFEGKFAIYSSWRVPFNGIPDSSSIESPQFALPKENLPIFLTFDHQFTHYPDRGNGIVQIWNGEKWVIVYDVGFQTIGYNEDATLRKVAIEHIDISNWLTDVDSTKIRLTFYHESGKDRGSLWLIDNLKVFTPPSLDVGTTAIQHNTLPYHCYTEEETIEVNIHNYGSQNINFEELPLNLHIKTTLENTQQNYVHTLNAGSLAMNQSQTISISDIDLSKSGDYYIQTFTSIIGDTTPKNDTSQLYRTTIEALQLPLPLLDFDNFSWEEARELGWSGNGVWYFAFDSEHPNGFSYSSSLGVISHVPLISPKFIAKDLIEISFDLALTDIDDKNVVWNNLRNENHIDIRISTDCGQSFETLHRITHETPIRQTGQKEQFRIEGYGNQEVILGIFTEEPNQVTDAYLNLYFDNIQIKEVAARDIGVAAAGGFIEGVYSLDMSVLDDWWVCGDFDYPVQIKLINHGTMLQNNFEVVGTISEGWNDDFSVLIGEPLYPGEERIITLGTTNTYNAGQYDLEAYIKLPNDDDHSNDTLQAFLLALPPQPSARFFYENEGEGKIQFAKAIFPGNPQYEWDFGDGKGNSTFRNPSYTYAENGTYDVTLTVTDDCGSNSYTEAVVVDTVVSIDDFDLEQALSITPNPSNGSFRIQIGGKTLPHAHIQVFATNGQLVFQENYQHFQSTNIQLNQSFPGIYFLQFATPTETTSLQFFLQ